MIDDIELSRIKFQEFFDGYIEGIRKYAYWDGGVQHVGSCCVTLEQAIEEARVEFGIE